MMAGFQSMAITVLVCLAIGMAGLKLAKVRRFILIPLFGTAMSVGIVTSIAMLVDAPGTLWAGVSAWAAAFAIAYAVAYSIFEPVERKQLPKRGDLVGPWPGSGVLADQRDPGDVGGEKAQARHVS